MVDLGLSKDGKEELALALLLWKDFKCQGKFDTEFYMQMVHLADTLGIRKELEDLVKKVLVPFEIRLKF